MFLFIHRTILLHSVVFAFDLEKIRIWFLSHIYFSCSSNKACEQNWLDEARIYRILIRRCLQRWRYQYHLCTCRRNTRRLSNSSINQNLIFKSQFIELFGDPVLNSKGLPVVQLSEHIQFLTSGSRGWAKYHSDVGEWFITIKNVKDCKISTEDIQCITPPKNAEADRTRLQEGDLLISITADLGRTGVVTREIADHGAYINQHLTCIRLNQDVLNPLYVAYFMESEEGKKQFFAKNLSSVKAGLNFDSIRSLQIMIPSLDKQNEFISFIQQLDKSKYVAYQLTLFLNKLIKYKLQSLFQEECICSLKM